MERARAHGIPLQALGHTTGQGAPRGTPDAAVKGTENEKEPELAITIAPQNRSFAVTVRELRAARRSCLASIVG